MIYGYLRVSTGKQDSDNQRFEILSYANSNKLSPVSFTEETISSRIGFHQRQLCRLIESAREGDVIIVSELS
jgi:DNA invertase Pin-like site-specific DNA recombinase